MNTFEAHAKPYLAAKVEVLKHATPRPADGTIVTIDVPAHLTDGSDAVMKVEIPWNTYPHGELDRKISLLGMRVHDVTCQESAPSG